MRIHTLLLLLPVTLFPVAALQKPAEKPADKAAPAEPLVPAQFLAPVENIVKQLAKGGREREVKDLISALTKLGYPKPNLDRLDKAAKDDLAKARNPLDSLPAGAKQLRITSKQLAVIMEKLPDGDKKEEMARAILTLDGECEPAHLVLGHKKVGRSWVRDEFTSLRQRRGLTLEKVAEAKKLEVEMEIGEIDDEYIQRACGVKATMVRRGNIELHSNFSPEKTSRILREVSRAVALGNWVQGFTKTRGGDDLKLPPGGDSKMRNIWVLIDSREQFKKLQSELAAEGKLSPEDVKLIQDPKVELGAFNVIKGPYIVLAQVENSAQASLLVAMSNMAEGIHTALSVGKLNWLALTCFGCTLPNYVFKEEFRKRMETHVETEDEKREREELMRLAKAGIAGSRTWMQYLAERNEDPPWRDSFLMALGAVSGNDMHKSTSMFEFIHEANLFRSLYSKLPPSKDATQNPLDAYNSALDRVAKEKLKEAQKEQADKAKKEEEEATKKGLALPDLPEVEYKPFALTVGELESKWRQWILGARPGVAERIDKQNLDAWPPQALEILAYMNGIRENTYAGSEKATRQKMEGLWKVKFDPELSEQCALHARYLTLNPEQQKWPDAHEEYADKEGYTVEGAWAGAHSVIVWGDLADGKEGVDGWMGTFYHRLPLTDPGVLRLGWGADGIYQVMDMSSLAAPYDKPFIVLYPYDGQKDVPTKFQGNELPDPVPDPEVEPGMVIEEELFGYPITIQTNPIDERKQLIDIDMKLYEGKDGKTEVECHFSTPSKPTNPELAPSGAWCLLPIGHLKPNQEYKVVANWTTGGTGNETNVGKHVEWTFKTK